MIKRETNMTSGKPGKLILTFAVPLIISNLGQQFYMIADSVIVGQGVGVKGLAAVGATDWTYWLFLWVVQGLAQGFSIPVAQSYGQGDRQRLKKALAMSLLLTLILGALLSIAGLLTMGPLLTILQTPDDVFIGAFSYLTFLFFGLIAVMAYNMFSAILRAFGNSRTPLIAMAVAAATNIILDLLFVMIFHWGVAGAAVATVLAQGIAALYCGTVLVKSGMIDLSLRDFHLDISVVQELLQNGLSLAFAHVLIAVGGMVLQSAINEQGSTFVAGITATNKLLGLLESSAISLGYAVTTFMAQNYGAQKYTRLREGLRSSIFFSVIIALIIGIVMLICGRLICGLFINSSDVNAAAVLDISYGYLCIMCYMLSALYILHVFRNALQGIGCGIATVVSGLMEFGARVSVALIFYRIWDWPVLFFAEPFAWCAATLSLAIMGMYYFHRLPKEDG